MLNPAHILETAMLLLAAFLVGATLGTLAKLLVNAATRRPAAVAAPAPAVEAARPPAALVTAPAIEPMARPRVPEAPLDVAAPDFSEALVALAGDPGKLAPLPEIEPTAPEPAAIEMAPAHVAGATTSGIVVPSPGSEPPVAKAAPDLGHSADVIPFPVESPQPEPPPVKAAVTRPEPEAEPAPKSDPLSATEPQSPVPESGAVSDDDDEAAAMRAIEGNWSPRRGAGAPAVRAQLPEDADAAVNASGEAVAAAVEAVRAVTEPDGRPTGLEAPRNGQRDELTHVIGILPIIETALNSLGLYHFDQVAALSDDEVRWLEAHLGIDGRITREHWREQSRELALATRPRLAAES